ncbi:hypothetical protein GGS20DRAFT_339813 [Poronia punctata]|nr:hypothetical protein GGS20DRAFT_339813 [Poronia punctata]
MGLSGPRNRRKLDHDPNNTRWTRDETTFGQKILRAHGWEPGKYLGAQNTESAQLHSAASLAPIKINLKDDTLGLGAKILQKQSDECTGLDVFKDLLGRLNGKSEETLEKERQVRSEIKTNLVIERKFGPMRFVFGGLLVGDNMQELVKEQPAPEQIEEESASEVDEPERPKKEKKEKKSKKRKVSDSEDADTSESKREKKRKRRSKEETEDDEDKDVKKSAKKKEKEKKKKERKSKLSEQAEEEKDADPTQSEIKRKKSKNSKSTSQSSLTNDSSVEPAEDAISGKARRKEEKKRKKDKKRKEADCVVDTVITTTISSTTVSASTVQNSGTSTPQSTGASTPQVLSGRHLARSRNIASKKMAYGDMQALNQIFMVKPV